jgi:hypothetical protein
VVLSALNRIASTAVRDALDRLVVELRTRHGTVHEMLERMDRSKDGFLSRHEIGRGLAEMGVQLTAAELDSVIEVFDHNGKVDYHEFYTVLTKHIVEATGECELDAPVSAAAGDAHASLEPGVSMSARELAVPTGNAPAVAESEWGPPSRRPKLPPIVSAPAQLSITSASTLPTPPPLLPMIATHLYSTATAALQHSTSQKAEPSGLYAQSDTPGHGHGQAHGALTAAELNGLVAAHARMLEVVQVGHAPRWVAPLPALHSFARSPCFLASLVVCLFVCLRAVSPKRWGCAECAAAAACSSCGAEGATLRLASCCSHIALPGHHDFGVAHSCYSVIPWILHTVIVIESAAQRWSVPHDAAQHCCAPAHSTAAREWCAAARCRCARGRTT